MAERFERNCPECGETLSRDARQCVCGWGKRKEKQGKFFDMQCQFRAGGSRCAYPVGMFLEGSTSGYCIFHRQPTGGGAGAQIVVQSQTVPYADAIQSIIERNADSAGAKATRALLKDRPAGGDRASQLVERAIEKFA